MADIIEEVAKAHGDYQATLLLADVQRTELKRKIRAARAAGLTLAEVAQLLGVSRQRVDQLSKD